MHDKYRKKYRAPAGTERLRKQIAVEAARRLLDSDPERAAVDAHGVADRTEAELYAAKRKAAAVLGHRVRPGDLPSDSEVREEAARLGRSRAGAEGPANETRLDGEDFRTEAAHVGDIADRAATEPPDGFEPPSLSERLERFTVYRMRLTPLEAVKLDPREHPEGDALYHSLQVYELAREARPYDEEFLLAALLHEVGRTVDPRDSANAAMDSLRGAVTERTLRLIAHLNEERGGRDLDDDDLDDMTLLRELDRRGRVAGAAVGSVEDGLEYLRGLERESYLES